MLDFIEDLKHILMALPPVEVVSFRDHYEDRMRESYDLALWDAAELIAEGCSDDFFADFRNWLIFMGRQTFKEALANPDSLAGPSSAPGIEDVFFEELRAVANKIYQPLTGEPLPSTPRAHYPPTRKRTKHRDSETDLSSRFPLLWAKYGPGGPASP